MKTKKNLFIKDFQKKVNESVLVIMDGFHALSLFLMYLSTENDFLQDDFISLIHLKILIHDTAFSLS